MPYEEPHYPQSHHLAKADLLSENAGPPLSTCRSAPSTLPPQGLSRYPPHGGAFQARVLISDPERKRRPPWAAAFGHQARGLAPLGVGKGGLRLFYG